MKLGDVLRKERERKKLTTADVSANLGLSQGEYEELEGGASTDLQSVLSLWVAGCGTQ